jgi:aerobic-type carbon monoxide dehydrogenase small subunit (CoxS/CutS family)
MSFSLDGEPASALQGDTLLVAVLQNRGSVRASEFGDGKRAGFCLMGACQDCWIWDGDGKRVRACSTPVVAGMTVFTHPPHDDWSQMAAFSAHLQAGEKDFP